MAYTIPTNEPESFTQGETVQWYKSFADFEPADWTLTYTCRGPSAFSIVATSSAGQYLLTITSAASALLPAGKYWYQAQVTSGTESHIVATGSFGVAEAFGNIKAGYDGRTHARRVLDSIEAVIEGRASQSDKNIEIDGRKIGRLTPQELMQFAAAYRAMVQAEDAAERRQKGQSAQKGIYTKFVEV